MEPHYMAENRYSWHIGSWRRPASNNYVAKTPEGEFEAHLQDLFLEGQAHLQHEEYTLGLQAFQEAMSLILHTVHPTMPVDPNLLGSHYFPLDSGMVTAVVAKTADILRLSTPVKYTFPPALISRQSQLPATVQEALKSVAASGIQVSSFQGAVQGSIAAGVEAAGQRDWELAAKYYQQALEQTPENEAAVRGGLQHDLALLNEKANHRDQAQQFAEASVVTFSQANISDGQAQALAMSSGMFARAGNTQRAAELDKQLGQLKGSVLLNDVVITQPVAALGQAATPNVNLSAVGAGKSLTIMRAGRLPTTPRLPGTVGGIGGVIAAPPLLTDSALTPSTITMPSLVLDPAAPALIGPRYIDRSTPVKSLTINGFNSMISLNLEATQAVASTQAFLSTLEQTLDIGLLTGWLHSVQFVAYVPHMYFFVLPMAMGDCHAGMGNLAEAQAFYAGVLPYPFINRHLEVTKVWTRLAQTALDLGDRAYRNAKDAIPAFATAKAHYETLVMSDNSLNPASPLYANGKFAAIKDRVTALLAAADPTQVDDNPAILTLVLQAKLKLHQIAAGLNFFGFAPDYTPPFSFEYLQNTARYFAGHASQTEQRYIQYKSTAENEAFRREQLNQQAEVARQTVILEQRGVAEAQQGIYVAQQSLNYAQVQQQNAVESKTDFDNARWELLELSSLEAWASASSVDRDDQVKLTVSNYNYYNTDSTRRNVVLQELATQRTLLTHDLEAARLDRAIESAQAYVGVASAQLGQAQARAAVAQQRVAIARLQQKQAEENRDFLDMREFSARLWYELAQQARRITQRYLDMGTEIAFLMERAYNAETERGLSVIRYDYQSTASGNLMGADLLLGDIDTFTFDYVTTIQAKKIPVKATLSLADSFPTQFHRLLNLGRCTFGTQFADFDRRHPGLYLAKIRNVEVVFVGLAGLRGICGTLRNIGVSRFRTSGGAVVERLYPADVMVLSQYEIRGDALAYRVNPNDLRLFENNGIDTLWQLDLPFDANDLDYRDILDVQLVLYYDGFFSPVLETQIRADLPIAGGASRAVSLRFSAPDELFYLKNQGEGELLFDSSQFPRNQKDLLRGSHTLKLTGNPATVGNLTLKLHSALLGSELTLTTDAGGEVTGAPLQDLTGKAVADRWRFTIEAAANPHLVKEGQLDLSGLTDLMVFFEYQFSYR